MIKNNIFYSNIGDFGCALNFEHRGGLAYVIDCIFNSNSNPVHPIGSGSAIKATGDYGTQVISIRNIYVNNTSLGSGIYGTYNANITDINSTYESKNKIFRINDKNYKKGNFAVRCAEGTFLQNSLFKMTGSKIMNSYSGFLGIIINKFVKIAIFNIFTIFSLIN